MGDSRLDSETRSIQTAVRTADSNRYLLIVDGERTRREMLPPRGTLLIGRSEGSDLTIEHASVSRRHARLTLGEHEATIADGGSHNGTAVNGVLVETEHRLVTGDVIAVGEVTIVFHDGRRRRQTRRLLPPASLIDRLGEEVDRALRYERTLGVLACNLPSYRRGHALLASAVANALSPSDITGITEDDLLVVLVPELDPDRLHELGGELAESLHGLCSEVRIGVAQCPTDGCDAATLVSAARAAATTPRGERVLAASSASDLLEIGDRSIVVADPAMSRVFDLLRRVADSDIAVLLSGETGCGKENAAYAVHCWSKRASGPFIPVNCAALPEALVESELFGHRKGAFSGATNDHAGRFEAASGGTIFLDELGELPAAAQAKLLRVLDNGRVTRVGENNERAVDVRVVAATNRDLEAEVEAGRFRRDLLYRLNAASVVLLPLRERQREIPILARRFLAAARARDNREPCTIADATLRLLAEHDWPGNVRELRNAIDFGAAVADAVLQPWHLPAQLVRDEQDEPDDQATPEFRPVAEELEEIERTRMAQALEATGWVQTRAADLISMPRRTFTMKMRKYGLRKGKS